MRTYLLISGPFIARGEIESDKVGQELADQIAATLGRDWNQDTLILDDLTAWEPWEGTASRLPEHKPEDLTRVAYPLTGDA